MKCFGLVLQKFLRDFQDLAFTMFDLASFARVFICVGLPNTVDTINQSSSGFLEGILTIETMQGPQYNLEDFLGFLG